MTCRPLVPPADTADGVIRHTLDAWDSALESYRAAAGGLTDYWAAAASRGKLPVDVAGDMLRWWQIASERHRPRWATPNEVVLRSDIARLRDFCGGADDDVVPTLVLPPQAGHDSCIVDYSAEQSQVKVIRAAGLTRLYSLDWVGATAASRNRSIDDYLGFLDRTLEHIGEPVNLIGDCQGGWLATIYAALRPERVNTLTIAGAPIDFHAGEPLIHNWVRILDSSRDLSFYERVVALGDGVMKGEFMLNGFIALKPESEVDKQVQLLVNLDDERYVRRHREFETWFKHTQDIPGAFYLWIVEHLFRDNALIRGGLELRGERVDLAAIDQPLFLLGGRKDHITPPDQVFALGEHASTPAGQITEHVSSGGHLGLFMGHEALREHWPPILEGVMRHSGPEARARRAEQRARSAVPRRRRPVPAY